MSEFAVFAESMSNAIKQLSDLVVKQNEEINNLEIKTSNLEATIAIIVSSISNTSPELFSAIKNTSDETLKVVKSQGHDTSELEKCLSTILCYQVKKQPVLRLVSPRSSSDSECKPTQ